MLLGTMDKRNRKEAHNHPNRVAREIIFIVMGQFSVAAKVKRFVDLASRSNFYGSHSKLA
jgi:hypothetical protein